MYSKECDGLEWQNWKNFNSGDYKLFKEWHTQKVHASISTSYVYGWKGIWLVLLCKVAADITTAKYTCPAGQGPLKSYKLATLCHALEDYDKLWAIVLEVGEESCISKVESA